MIFKITQILISIIICLMIPAIVQSQNSSGGISSSGTVTNGDTTAINLTFERRIDNNVNNYEDSLRQIFGTVPDQLLRLLALSSSGTSTYTKASITISQSEAMDSQILLDAIFSPEFRSAQMRASSASSRSIRLGNKVYDLELNEITQNIAIEPINNKEIALMYTITDVLERDREPLSIQRHWDSVRQAGCWAYEHSCAKSSPSSRPEYRDYRIFLAADPSIFTVGGVVFQVHTSPANPYTFLGIEAELQFQARNVRRGYNNVILSNKIITESVEVPHDGLIEVYGADFPYVVVEATGNNPLAGGPFEDGEAFGTTLRLESRVTTETSITGVSLPTLFYVNQAGELVEYPFMIQNAFRNIRTAIQANKVVYVAGYDVLDERGNRIDASTIMQHPVHEHSQLGRIVRANQSTGCELVEEGCFFMPFVWRVSGPQNLDDPTSRLDRNVAGTSFSSPSFGGILASALALAPHKSGSEIVQLAKDCAEPIDGLAGHGIPNYPCMERRIREDDTIYAELSIAVSEENINIQVGHRQQETSTLTEIILTPRLRSSDTAIHQIVINNQTHPISSEATVTEIMLFLPSPTDTVDVTIETVNPFTHVIEVTGTGVDNLMIGTMQQRIRTDASFLPESKIFTAPFVRNVENRLMLITISEDGEHTAMHTIIIQRLNAHIVDIDNSPNEIMENSRLSNTEVSGIRLAVFGQSDQQLSAEWQLIGQDDDIFRIDTNNQGEGILIAQQSLNYEEVSQYTLNVNAVIEEGEHRGQFFSNLIVDVINVLEEFTVIDANPSSNYITRDAIYPMTVSGLALASRDERGMPVPAIWGLTKSENDIFIINTMTGVVSLSPTALLNRERGSYEIIANATAEEQSSFTDSITITIQVGSPIMLRLRLFLEGALQ